MIVALTHSLGRFEGLTALLEAHGLTVQHAPLIQTGTVWNADLTPLQACPWWIVTSRATVAALCDLNANLKGKHLAAVGSATARALEEWGAKAALIAPQSNASSLAAAFLGRHPDVRTVGFPCGQRALPTLTRLLERAGIEVRRVIVYRTITQRWRLELQADLVLLASPSAVQALPDWVARTASLIALGATTAEVVRARGLTCEVSLEMGIQAVCDAILRAAQIRADVQLEPTR